VLFNVMVNCNMILRFDIVSASITNSCLIRELEVIIQLSVFLSSCDRHTFLAVTDIRF